MKKLKALYDLLKVEFPHLDQRMYGYDEKGAVLAQDWLLQTPNVWGKFVSEIPMAELRNPGPGVNPDFRLPICSETGDTSVCRTIKATVARPGEQPQQLSVGHSTHFVDHFYEEIIKAEEFAFISALGPAPDENFRAALANAVTFLAHTGRNVEVLVYLGYALPLEPYKEAKALYDDLTRRSNDLPGSRVRVTVMVSGGPLSWNHSKVLVVDAKAAITGGHNYYHHRYLQKDPVSDISMKFTGKMAEYCFHFYRESWNRSLQYTARAVVGNRGPLAEAEAATAGMEIAELDFQLPKDMAPATDHESGLVAPALAVGRLSGAWDTEPSERAILYLLENATESIKISQQSISWGWDRILFWPEKYLNAIASFIITRKKPVYIVQSNTNAKDGYSSTCSIQQVYEKLMLVAKARPGAPDEKQLRQLFHDHLHIGAIRFGENKAWADKTGFGSHAKFLMVDDELLYIGSHNMYPTGPLNGKMVGLHEFGIILESREAAKAVLSQYWNQLWKYTYYADIKTEKPAYNQGETVEVDVMVRCEPESDSFSMRDENGDEVFWTWTNNIRSGRVTWNRYKIDDKYIPGGQLIRVQYLFDGHGERRAVGKTSFLINKMEVEMKTDKPVYRVGEDVRVDLLVKNVKPKNDAITFHRANGDEDSYKWTDGVTNGRVPSPWRAPAHLKGQEVTIHYRYDGGLGGKKIIIATTRFRIE